jgi:16S rRNA (cytosine967-C5)-methyltransferase
MVEIQRLASRIVGRVLAGRSLDAELAALWVRHPQLAERERAAVQELAYGTLRFLGHLQALLDELLDRPLRDARLRALLLTALYQLEYTRTARHAIVDYAVQCAGTLSLSSAMGLVNAVLRNLLRARVALAARVQCLETARYSHPQWWIDKLRAQYPARFEEVLAITNSRPPLTLRVNRRRTTPGEFLRVLEARGVHATIVGDAGVMLDRPLPAGSIPGLADGIVSVQDAGAQLAAPMLDLAGGERVLDACAAPGGKAAHVLEFADVALTALDNDAGRLGRLHGNLGRLGLAATVVCGDAGDPGAWWDGRTFDRILADVPCTASGVARRHPDIKWLRRVNDIEQMAIAQRRMLDALWRLLCRGGKLLYATCSVFQEENHLQVRQFLQSHEDAQRLSLAAADNDPELPAGQLLPDRQHDGFFYALLQKR